METVAEMTLSLLNSSISKVIGFSILEDQLNILVGFSPERIECNNSHALVDTGIQNGSIWIIGEKAINAEGKEVAERVAQVTSLSETLAAQAKWGASAGILLKGVLQADNSHLYTFVSYLMTSALATIYVAQDKKTYNKGISSDEYIEFDVVGLFAA